MSRMHNNLDSRYSSCTDRLILSREDSAGKDLDWMSTVTYRHFIRHFIRRTEDASVTDTHDVNPFFQTDELAGVD
jgi:hypothetical protein